ncbi:MAG TPA: hypothetical protein PLV92_22550, partial [Pirellulaceae bacterium]|nr:hypothetical protein [Pirellulaceae bacterium]
MRAALKVDPAAAGTKVSGKLSIVRNNLFVVQDLPPMNAPFEVPSEATLYELGGTLNFRSPELAQMIGGSIEFRIDLTDASGSTVFDHWSRMFWLHPPVPLRVYWLAVALPPQRGKSAEVMPADVKPGTADAFLRATFPIADDPSCCEWLDTDPLEYTGDLGANEKVDVGDEADDLVLAISQYIDLIDDPSLPEGTYRRVFGWIPEDSAVSTQRRLAFYGWSDRKESACATTLPLEFQATLAHELAHTFGEGESSENSPAEDSISPGVGFDPGDRLFGNPASNAVPESTRFFKPDTSNGMMTPGCKAWESWIGESCYWRLLRFAPSPVEIDPNPFAFARSAAFILRGTFTRGVIHAPKVRLVVKVPYPPPPEPHFPPKPFHAASIECIGEIVYRTARVDGLRNVSLSVRPGKSGLEVTQSVRFAATPSAGSVEAATDGPNQSAAERDLHFVARFAVPQDA